MTIVLYLYASLLLLCIASIPVYIFIITVRRINSNSIYEDSIGGADLGDSNSNSSSSSSNSLIYTPSKFRDNSTTRSWTMNTSLHHHLQEGDSSLSEEELLRRHKLLKLQNYQSHWIAVHVSNGSSSGRLTRKDRDRSSDSHSRAARNDSSIHLAAASNRSSSSSVHQTNRTRSKLAYLKHPPSVSFEYLRLQAFSDEYDAYVGQGHHHHLDQVCGNVTTLPQVLRAVAVVNMNMSAKPSSVNMSMSAESSTCIDYVYNTIRAAWTN